METIARQTPVNSVFVMREACEDARDEADMDVELGVNLADAFSMTHKGGFSCVATGSDCSFGMLEPEAGPDGPQSTMDLDLDDVTRECLRRVLMDNHDASPVPDEANQLWSHEDREARSKLAMVKFLYAFDKFQIVYA